MIGGIIKLLWKAATAILWYKIVTSFPKLYVTAYLLISKHVFFFETSCHELRDIVWDMTPKSRLD